LNLHNLMNAAMWPGEDIALVALCVVLGILALAFFIAVYVADFRETKRKSDARRALRDKGRHSH
jgi:hypothetical protein